MICWEHALIGLPLYIAETQKGSAWRVGSESNCSCASWDCKRGLLGKFLFSLSFLFFCCFVSPLIQNFSSLIWLESDYPFWEVINKFSFVNGILVCQIGNFHVLIALIYNFFSENVAKTFKFLTKFLNAGKWLNVFHPVGFVTFFFLWFCTSFLAYIICSTICTFLSPKYCVW